MKSINFYIETSNRYLLDKYPNAKPITLEDIKNRLTKTNFLGLESTKTRKGEKQGFLTAILYLAPHKIVGFNMCPLAITCIKDCLDESGRGRFESVKRARIVKTLCWIYDKKAFTNQINKDIERYKVKAKKLNLRLAVRLNGTSDINIQYHFKDTLNRFKTVFFYDYTKVYSYIKNNRFPNYHLTFSYDGTKWNTNHALKCLNLGYNVAVVFSHSLPSKFLDFKVIDGNKTDLRFLDESSCVVGLTYKKVGNKYYNNTFVF